MMAKLNVEVAESRADVINLIYHWADELRHNFSRLERHFKTWGDGQGFSAQGSALEPSKEELASQ